MYGFDHVCWYGFYRKEVYWIVEGPIMLAMLLNILFLVNVMRILYSKLKRPYSADSVEQMKKSLKAAILLFPLLGITHLMEIFPFYQRLKIWHLDSIYAVFNCFLVFFSGVYLSFLYCFANYEVRVILRRYWMRIILRNSVWKKKYEAKRYLSVQNTIIDDTS